MNLGKLFGTPSTTVEDFDSLLKLAGKGNFQELLNSAQVNAASMQKQADGMTSDALGTESAAKKVYEEETRVARQKLQVAEEKADVLRGQAVRTGKKAKEAANLLVKFKK